LTIVRNVNDDISIMKQRILLGLLFLSFISFGQTKTVSKNKFFTTKYAGIYSYGKDIEKGRIGAILIYPETDSTILFYIELNRGAPSYNMGSLYGQVKLKGDTGVFYTKVDDAEIDCKWTFHFTKNSLRITTVDEDNYCGFGYTVIADGKFKRKSNKSADFFYDLDMKKTYFRTTKPEDYYKTN